MYANRFISIVSSSPPDRPILSHSGGHLTVEKVTAVLCPHPGRNSRQTKEAETWNNFSPTFQTRTAKQVSHSTNHVSHSTKQLSHSTRFARVCAGLGPQARSDTARAHPNHSLILNGSAGIILAKDCLQTPFLYKNGTWRLSKHQIENV